MVPRFSIPTEEIANGQEKITLEPKESLCNEIRGVMEAFSHWPHWALVVMQMAFNRLAQLPESARKKMAVKASKERLKRKRTHE
jgi:hypothetical protein